jgi:hypothetical protein
MDFSLFFMSHKREMKFELVILCFIRHDSNQLNYFLKTIGLCLGQYKNIPNHLGLGIKLKLKCG